MHTARPTAEILLRSGSAEMPPLKEKFVDIYERFFRGEDPYVDWDELLLLKVNVRFIERCMALTSEEELIQMSRTMRVIFRHILQGLSNTNTTRVCNALETLSTLLHGLFRKKFRSFGPQIIEIVCGFEGANQFFGSMIGTLQLIISKETSSKASIRAIRVLTMLACGCENPDHNSLVEYLLPEHHLFDTLVGIIGKEQGAIVDEAVLLLCCISSYQRHESRNQWRSLLALLTGEPLRLLAQGLSKLLAIYVEKMTAHLIENETEGIMASLWHKLAALLLLREDNETPAQINIPTWSIGSVLLLLYDLCYLNAVFREQYLVFKEDGGVLKQFLQSSSFSLQAIPPVSSGAFDRLAFSSEYQRARITMLTLTALSDLCPTELHDPTILMPFCVYDQQKSIVHDDQTLAFGVYDVVTLFIAHNIRKTLHMDLYCQSVQILTRLLIEQVRLERTLPYTRFQEMWHALMRIIELLLRNSDALIRTSGGMELCAKTVNIFNIFLSHGDTLLPSADSFDALVYELTRQKRLFDELYQIAELNLDASPWCARIKADLAGIRSVTQHFTQEVGIWVIEHRSYGLDVNQAMDVVKEHYGTLKLSVDAHLDWIVPYAEHPKESPFIRQYSRSLVQDCRRLLPSVPL